ncbi:SAF domain-containing protein [Jatrophihabitans cynanchi]|uniref:SAF domain-containing protein n=1 Tax=Jatrophihabitans cynanchi TaxID=2944128 RepID=A0ABY7K0W4_9ACTN|nr:SAF domain-containing protein [Jatrophihabitans sp. SB3-54]WAX58493.1 SAF domain-containing protein [Jatrophihabitans sp. SB3-54]
MIISVLVVLVGGLIAFAGTQLLTQHAKVLAVAKDVPVGARITDDDLTTASVVKDANLSPIPASDRSEVVGQVAQVALVKGTLLTRAQVGPSSGFTAGQQLVALPLKPGQFPGRGLVAGQKVLIVATPGDNGAAPTTGGSTGSGGSTSGGGTTPGVDGTVVDVGVRDPATQVTVVDVKVAAADGVPVARLASTGNIAVILLPAGR